MNQIVGRDQKGVQFVALVLEPGNVERIRRDEPIRVHLESLFPDGIPRRLDILIGYTSTPQADAEKLRSQAEVTLDERAAFNKTQPHCPQCKSTLEQIALYNNHTHVIPFCPSCGCALGFYEAQS
jgi:hypothetical protein